MKKNTYISLAVIGISLALIYNNCSGSSGGGGGGTAAANIVTTTTPVATMTGNNVVTLGLGGYTNEPFVTVQICAHSTGTCYSITNVLVDSGSSGLRVFSNTLPPAFVATLPGGTIGECQTYIGAPIDWGPVKTADVMLGSETATNVPVQIINNAFGDSGVKCYNQFTNYLVSQGFVSSGSGCSVNNQNTSVGCPSLDQPGPHYNGIIGVNFLKADCGDACATITNGQTFYQYLSCPSTVCTGVAMPDTSQVSNPVAYFPVDNNGVMFVMPSTGNDNNLSGYLVLGIGTETNNTPAAGVQTLKADPNEGDTNFTLMNTLWQGQTIYGFLDTGSQTSQFPYSNTVSAIVANYPIMAVNSDVFVPSTPQTFSINNSSYDGTNTVTTSFSVADPTAALNTPYNVINYLAVEDTSGLIDGQFDFGFPFFLGRTVYVGLEGTTSSLGSGLYWAY